MTLLINVDDAQKVLGAKETIEALYSAFLEEAMGSAVNRNKSNIHIPTDEEGYWYRFSTMEGGLKEMGVVAIRLKSDICSWPVKEGKMRDAWHSVRPGKYGGLILLYSAKNGELLAILNDGYIQHMRVGATAALGAKYSAREDCEELGILGSGGMAEAHALCFAQVRPLQRIKVYSPNRTNREHFAQRMSGLLGIEVQPVSEPYAAVENCNLVCCCTDAVDPVYLKTWVHPGLHLTVVHHSELEPSAYGDFDRCIRYWSGTNLHLFTTPETQRPPRLGGSGKETANLDFSFKEKTVLLPDVLAGKAQGRLNDEEVTFFISEGTGVQFAATSLRTYELALKNQIGRELPTDWFLQDVRN